MVVFISNIDKPILTIRLPSPPGIKVDRSWTVTPNESWQGYTYEELTTLGIGQHDIPLPKGK